MTNTTLTQGRPSGKMASQPKLLRTTPDRPSMREAVAGQFRYLCGGERWSAVELAEILNVSVNRARHLLRGRRPALVDEIESLCRAVDTPIVKFFEEATERRDQRFVYEVFADTTVEELAEMADLAGTTPDRLLTSRGWSRCTKAEVPAYLGGDA